MAYFAGEQWFCFQKMFRCIRWMLGCWSRTWPGHAL